MPLELPENLRSELIVCGLSGKRFTGVADLHELLKPLMLPGQVTLVPKDGLCSVEAVNRYVRWAKATFFVRVEASDEVRRANGWRAEFGPEDYVRDEHWTETALDDWDGWDARVYNNGDEDALMLQATELAARINALAKDPKLCKHQPIPSHLLRRTEHTSLMPENMVPGWGVNPPTKNIQGEYESKVVNPTANYRAVVDSSVEPNVSNDAGSSQDSKTSALQAAAARAATAATRWGRKQDDASGQCIHTTSTDQVNSEEHERIQAPSWSTNPDTGRDSRRSSISGLAWHSGATGWAEWASQGAASRQRSSSRGRWDSSADGTSWDNTWRSSWGSSPQREASRERQATWSEPQDHHASNPDNLSQDGRSTWAGSSWFDRQSGWSNDSWDKWVKGRTEQG